MAGEFAKFRTFAGHFSEISHFCRPKNTVSLKCAHKKTVFAKVAPHLQDDAARRREDGLLEQRGLRPAEAVPEAPGHAPRVERVGGEGRAPRRRLAQNCLNKGAF